MYQEKVKLNGASTPPYNPKVTGLVERKNGVFKEQLKLLTRRPTLAKGTEVLSHDNEMTNAWSRLMHYAAWELRRRHPGW